MSSNLSTSNSPISFFVIMLVRIPDFVFYAYF